MNGLAKNHAFFFGGVSKLTLALLKHFNGETKKPVAFFHGGHSDHQSFLWWGASDGTPGMLIWKEFIATEWDHCPRVSGQSDRKGPHFFFLASAQGVYAVYLPWSSSEKIRKDLKISETSGTPTLFSWYISILWNSNGGSKISDRWGVWDVFQQRSTWQAGQPGSSCSQRGVEAKQRTRQVQLGWNWRLSSDF